MSHKPKYPPKILLIIKECPLAYGIIILHDFVNKKYTEEELYVKWQRDKRLFNNE